jgi:hypothetical protein
LDVFVMIQAGATAVVDPAEKAPVEEMLKTK